MESLKLKRLKRKLRRKESSRFNFGQTSDGKIITSTYNPKAHTYNKLIRKINEERDANFAKMLEAFENGEVSNKKPAPKSKRRRSYEYKLSIACVNDTKAFIKMMVESISKDCNQSAIYLCYSK